MPKWSPVNNAVLSVAEWAAYVADQVISQVTAATRPSGTAGEEIYETDTTRYQGYDGSAWVQTGGLTSAALNSYNPTIDQGVTNIGKTVTYSQFQRFGNWAAWTFNLALTGAGTAGSVVTLTLPVAAATTSTALGHGRIHDTSAPNAYTGTFINVGSSTVTRFYPTVAGSTAWGATPNLALASGDSIHGALFYPVA